MSKFVRGAKVREDDRELTMIEASFVVCSIAEREGMKEAGFLEYMARAWKAYHCIDRTRGSPSNG